MELDAFLQETEFTDFSAPCVRRQAQALFLPGMGEVEMARAAFAFVRDEIPHSFDIHADVVTATASQVLAHKTGICYAKANLLAALLRAQGIPAGFCYQRLTRADDDRDGYCLHCFNAVWLQGHWVFVDARGNTGSIRAQFSLGQPQLAFPVRPQYDERVYNGIFSAPEPQTMALLLRAKTIEEVYAGLPAELSPQYRPAFEMR